MGACQDGCSICCSKIFFLCANFLFSFFYHYKFDLKTTTTTKNRSDKLFCKRTLSSSPVPNQPPHISSSVPENTEIKHYCGVQSGCAARWGPATRNLMQSSKRGGLWWWRRALPPCEHHCGSASLAISPLLKRPGLVPSRLLSTCESGEAGRKNCPAGDARLKVKEDERGQPGRLQSSGFLRRSLLAAGDIIKSYLFFIFHFSDRDAEIAAACVPETRPTCCCCYFSCLPAVKLTFNVTFALRTNTVRQMRE